MDYTNIHQIREIVGSAGDAVRTEKLVNAYLARGWVLLSVHQCGDGKGTMHLQTAYIIGHQEADAEPPRFEPDEHTDEHRGARTRFVPGAFLWG
jgi:hypothetical protein